VSVSDCHNRRFESRLAGIIHMPAVGPQRLTTALADMSLTGLQIGREPELRPESRCPE
jgi:hypothetical protein